MEMEMEMEMEIELKEGAETGDGDGNGGTYNMKCSMLLLLLPHETGRQHEMHFNCMSSNCNVFAHTYVRVEVYTDKDTLAAF